MSETHRTNVSKENSINRLIIALLGIVLSIETVYAESIPSKCFPIPLSGGLVVMVPVKSIGFTPDQRLIADKIISVFENNTTALAYGYAEHIVSDQHGITAGRAGFTSATGDMLMVIERYAALKPEDNPLSQYIDELKRLEKIYIDNGYELSSEGADVENLDGLIDAWKLSADDALFRKIQDEVVDELYFNPALEVARTTGAVLPITLLNIYDASIQHGIEGVRDIIDQISPAQPKDGGDEIAWLKAFNEVRLDVMLNTIVDGEAIWKDTVYRQHELVDMIEERNYNLDPFTMIIEDWGNEVFELSL
jgi:chitosanase